MSVAEEVTIRDYWQENPCCQVQVGAVGDDVAEYFARYDAIRYGREPHILRVLDDIDFRGKDVLEIGFGQGAESEQMIRRGARWNGIDLTGTALERTGARLAQRGLAHGRMVHGSARQMEFADRQFDLVFSHGVLHHIPEIKEAQREIRRVLRPDGELVIMVYAKWSLNYLLAIAVLRRLGLLALYPFAGKGDSIYDEHVRQARAMGLGRYLALRNFVHRNTDGPLNPYSKVYGVREVAEDFPDFEVVRSYKVFLQAPPLPIPSWARPLERHLGWHLWVHLKPRKAD